MASNPILVPANQAQWRETLKRFGSYFGKPLSQDQFEKREEKLAAQKFSQDGKFRCWVLVPASDPTTIDFYCSCESYRRDVGVSSSSKEVFTLPSHSIASVFTHPKYRGKGYANLMMTLLRDLLGGGSANLPVSPAESQQPFGPSQDPKLDPGVCSFLFSDIGDYYSRCGKGWHIHSPKETSWKVDELEPAFEESEMEFPSKTVPAQIIGESDFDAVAAIDTALLKHEISVHQQHHGQKATFAVLPTGEEFAWLTARSKVYAEVLGYGDIQVWGVEVGYRPEIKKDGSVSHSEAEKWGYAIYFYDFVKAELQILRLRCGSPQLFPHILFDAMTVAKSISPPGPSSSEERSKIKTILGWNISDKLVSDGFVKKSPDPREGDPRLVKTGASRDHSLPAVAWFGAPGATNTESEEEVGKGVHWIANEKYAWC